MDKTPVLLKVLVARVLPSEAVASEIIPFCELFCILAWVLLRSTPPYLFIFPLACETLAVIGRPLTILVGLSVMLILFCVEESGLVFLRGGLSSSCSLELVRDCNSSSASTMFSVTVNGFYLSVASTEDRVGPLNNPRFGTCVLIARW